jgi:hypothetical protein
MKQIGRQLIICHQHLALAFIVPFLCLALNLTGQTENPVSVTLEDCQKEGIIIKDEDSQVLLTLCYVQVLNAYILGDRALAERSLTRIGTLSQNRYSGTHFGNYVFAALDGLVNVWCQRV